MRENFVQPMGMSFQANQEMQGRGSEKEIHHEAILHADAKSSHAMRNSKDRSFKENLENFLESNSYMLYIISKIRKLGVQRFKRCAIWSWNEEVMAIWRRLHKVEEEFRIDISWCENFRIDFALTFLNAKIFAAHFPNAKISALTFSDAKFFTPPVSNAKM